MRVSISSSTMATISFVDEGFTALPASDEDEDDEEEADGSLDSEA